MFPPNVFYTHNYCRVGLYQAPTTSDVWHHLLKPMHNSRAHLGEGAVGGRLWGARGRGRSPAGRFPGLPAPSSRARLLQPRRASPSTALAPHGPPCDLLPTLPASRTPGPELSGALRKAAAAVTVHHPASAPRLCHRVPRPAGYRPRVAPQPVFPAAARPRRRCFSEGAGVAFGFLFGLWSPSQAGTGAQEPPDGSEQWGHLVQ